MQTKQILIAVAIGAVLIGAVKRYRGKPEITTPEVPKAEEMSPEEKNVRLVVARFYNAIMRHDSKTLIELIDVPWFYEVREPTADKKEGIYILNDRDELNRPFIEMSKSKPEETEEPNPTISITSAQRWVDQQPSDTNELERFMTLQAIAKDNGWVVRTEAKDPCGEKNASFLLVVMKDGTPKICGMWEEKNTSTTGTLKGIIKYKGSLPEGEVSVFPQQGREFRGQIKAGRYVVSNIPVGKAVCRIELLASDKEQSKGVYSHQIEFDIKIRPGLNRRDLPLESAQPKFR